MKQFYTKILFITLLLLGVFVYAELLKTDFKESPQQSLSKVVSIDLTDVSLSSLDGREYSFTSFATDLIVVHFWGTWCPSCIDELPQFLTKIRQLDGSKVTVLLVAVNDTAIKVKKFLKSINETESDKLILLDHDSRILNEFGSEKVPETYLLDRNGKVLKHFEGPQDWSSLSLL